MEARYPDGSTFYAEGNLRDVMEAAERVLKHGAERVVITALDGGKFAARQRPAQAAIADGLRDRVRQDVRAQFLGHDYDQP